MDNIDKKMDDEKSIEFVSKMKLYDEGIYDFFTNQNEDDEEIDFNVIDIDE